MSDKIIRQIFIFLQEVFSTGKGDLVNVFVHFFCSHPNSLVRYGKCFCLFIKFDPDGEIT